MSLKNTVFVMLLTVALAACVSLPTISHYALISLNKGMNPEQSTAALKIAPASVHQVSVDNVSYTFHRYYLNNGQFSNLYLLCFEAGKLKYWGYVEEFRRYPDKRINQALEAVLPELRAIKE